MTDIEIHLSQRLTDEDYHKITEAMTIAYRQGKSDGAEDFTETLLSRLTDAIHQKDVESMSNLIKEVAEEVKEQKWQ